MDHKEFDALLSDTEIRLERLRALYEQWFQGLERLEPTVPAKDVERRMQMLRKVQPQVRNTALRFRFQTIWQRYTTFQTYWRRVARQIEEGTYRRDIMRVRARRDDQRRRQTLSGQPPAASWDLDIDVEEAQASGPAGELAADPPVRSVRPASSAPVPTSSKPPRSYLSPFARTPGSQAPPKPSPGASPPPRGREAPAANGPGDDRLRALYQQYIDARKRNNERTDNVPFETLAKSIRAMVPKLQSKSRGGQIDFEVVVRNGRVALKPVSKK